MQENDRDETNPRMTTPGKPPGPSKVAAWMGRDAYQIWRQVARLIERNYPDTFSPDWRFGGKKHGWSLRYKKGKSFCTLIPEKRGLAILMVFGAEERAKVEGIRGQLSARTQKEYDGAMTYHDGKWVFLTVDAGGVVEDVRRLLAVKRKPKNVRKGDA